MLRIDRLVNARPSWSAKEFAAVVSLTHGGRKDAQAGERPARSARAKCGTTFPHDLVVSAAFA
jgi:hypothetical protein